MISRLDIAIANHRNSVLLLAEASYGKPKSRKPQYLKIADSHDNQFRAEIKSLMLDIIGEDIEAYQPYLVASRRLGLEQNQTQAKMIVQCINNTKREQRKKLEEL